VKEKAMGKIWWACGIAGGTWGLIAPIFTGLISPQWTFTAIWWYLPLLSLVSLMGALALIAMVLSKRRPRLKILVWICALVIAVASFLGLFTWGLLLLPASILLILAAVGLRGHIALLEEAK
jgi:hypothetical protein